jgi:hypothetical protein
MGGTRNPNFSEMDIQVLLDEVEKNRSLIFSKLTNVVTNNKKARVWDAICERVNSVNATKHVWRKLEKSFPHTLVRRRKKIAQQRRESAKTGGGTTPSMELTPLQENVSGILGNTPIEGIDGGIETHLSGGSSATCTSGGSSASSTTGGLSVSEEVQSGRFLNCMIYLYSIG